METINYKGHTIEILQDEDAQSPREWDNVGIMECYHGQYNLGDDVNRHEFDSWQDLHDQLKKEGAAIILPLRLYDHSGITISCGNEYPYNDAWDSMIVGFIYVSAHKIREEYNVKRISKKLRERVRALLQSEVATYDDYLTGNVYGYSTDTGDSCWGFFGDEGIKEATQEARACIDQAIEQERAERNAKLKTMLQNKVPLQKRAEILGAM